ncbi:hypothetical protein AQUCO_11800026v1 [Aquilegia coerulea]|uniref:Uncharacterized protein n=2 Tax=Aquilegia coerulea TaxID=218851 RepID=A0A2G5C229_AQUCA|nr:hypothetical protein AQUCO_11800026v1 [Aquilegia coerulea]
MGEDIRKLEYGVHVDESDEMLSRGFKDQIYDVCGYLPPDLQAIILADDGGARFQPVFLRSAALDKTLQCYLLKYLIKVVLQCKMFSRRINLKALTKVFSPPAYKCSAISLGLC